MSQINLLVVTPCILCGYCHHLFQPFGKDDVIGCFLDLDSATIKFSKNGETIFPCMEYTAAAAAAALAAALAAAALAAALAGAAVVVVVMVQQLLISLCFYLALYCLYRYILRVCPKVF